MNAFKVIVVLFCFLWLPISGTLTAEEQAAFLPESFPHASAQSLEKLKVILSSEDFGGEKDGWGIKLKNPGTEHGISSLPPAPWMEKSRRLFGLALRTLAILTLTGFLGLAFLWFWKNRNNYSLKNLFHRKQSGNFLRDIVPHSAGAETLFSQAGLFFEKGFYREAWAACFAGCLEAYTRYHGVSFPEGATERGCQILVQKDLPDKAEGFGFLVQNWIPFAYGEKIPARDAFENALAFGLSLLKTDDPGEAK